MSDAESTVQGSAKNISLMAGLAVGAVGLAGIGYYFYSKPTESEENVEAPEDALAESTATASDSLETEEGTLKPVVDSAAGSVERSTPTINSSIERWWKGYRTPKGVKVSAIGTYRITKIMEPKKSQVFYAYGIVPTQKVTVNKGQDKIALLRLTVQASPSRKHQENLYLVVKPNRVILLGNELLRRVPSVGEVAEQFNEEIYEATAQQTGQSINSRIHNIAINALNVVLSNDQQAMRAAPSSTPWAEMTEQAQWSGLRGSALAGAVRDALVQFTNNNVTVIEQVLSLLKDKSVIQSMPAIASRGLRSDAKNNPDISAIKPYLPLAAPAAAFFITDRYFKHKGLLLPSLAAVVAYMGVMAATQEEI